MDDHYLKGYVDECGTIQLSIRVPGIDQIIFRIPLSNGYATPETTFQMSMPNLGWVPQLRRT